MPARDKPIHLLDPAKGWRRIGFLITTLVAISVLVFGTESPGGAVGEASFRVEPPSLIIDQPCPESAAASSPTLSASIAGHERAPKVIASPFRNTGVGTGERGMSVQLADGAMAMLGGSDHIVIQDFVIDQGYTASLDLHRIQPFNAQTVFVAGTAAGDRPLATPQVALFAGTVLGRPGSAVFLGVSTTGVNGYIRLGDTMRVLSSGPQSAESNRGRALIADLASIDQGRGNSWTCGTSEIVSTPASLMAGTTTFDSAGLAGTKICNVAIDCDYQFYLQMGGNEAAAIDYVTTLVGAVSSIYERDVRVTLRLSYARVWTTEDPYRTCGFNGLLSFQSQFNPTGPAPHLKYKFSGCGGAGAAYGTLVCPATDLSGTPVAAARVQGYFPYPLAQSDSTWDVYVVAHEIGHIFGSPHTHCYDPPIDRCISGEGLCYDGEVVCTPGSIMSYCNNCGGMSNIVFEFPPTVVARMQPHIARGCMEVSGGALFVHNDGETTLRVDSVVPLSPWLTASRSTFFVAPHDSEAVVVIADWDSFTDLQQSGEIAVYCAGAPSAQSALVTANRIRPIPKFSAGPLSGCAPLMVSLTDQSLGVPATWEWNFGDDSTSADRNPAHVYTRPGIYVARLTVSNACGESRAGDSALVTVKGPACRFESPVIVNRDDSLIKSYDLWHSIGNMGSSPGVQQFGIVANTNDSCGARIDNNRFLSVAPVRGWTGSSFVTIHTSEPSGCDCEAKVRVIINEPPTIQLEIPDATIITNHRAIIGWQDFDPNDDARIVLYRSDSSDCSAPIAITGKPLSEDEDGHGGAYEWHVAGVPDGRYFIRATIADLKSSEESCSEGSVVVDLTPPVTSILMTCAELDSNGWCRAEGLVTLPATDNLSGIARTTYRVNRSGWARYSRPFRVKAQGPTLIEYFSTDVAGNSEVVHSAVQPFKIDTRSPYITSLTMDNNRFADGDFMSSTPKFSFQLVDDGSGISLSKIKIDITPGTPAGALEFKDGSAGFFYDSTTFAAHVTVNTPLSPGQQSMIISVADLVGNTATQTVGFQVGSELQLMDLVPFPNPARGPMEFTFKLSQDADVSIRVFDLSGNLVRKMENIPCKAGYNAVPWNGWTDSYGILSSGAYVYDITAKNDQGTVHQLDKLAVIR